ncbi:MAG: AsmA family protein [Candidatus Delongbacteria bacterium]|nr:AsmA family protein [Candidatus Delongbacteria bacterium]
MSRFIKIIMITALAIAVLLIGLLITLRIMFPKEKIMAMVLPVISKTLNRDVVIRDVGFSVFPDLAVQLEKLQIANDTAVGFSRDIPWLKLENFRLELSWKSLLKRQLVINEIRLDQQELWIEVNSEGRYNFESLGGISESPDPALESDTLDAPAMPAGITLNLKSLSINQGKIVYSDHALDQTVVLGDINQQTSLVSDADFNDIRLNGTMTIRQVRVDDRTIPKEIPELQLSLDHEIHINLTAGQIELTRIRASLQKFYVDLKGMVNDYHSLPHYDLTIETDTFLLDDIIHEIPPSLYPNIAKIKAGGRFGLNARISGVIDSLNPERLPAIQGTLFVDDGSIRYQGFEKGIDDLDLRMVFTDDEINLNDLRIRSGADSIRFHFRLSHFNAPLIDGELAAEINLDQLKTMMPMPQEFDLQGRISSQLRIVGQVDTLDYQKLNVNGKTLLRGIRVQTPELPAPLTMEAEASFSNALIQIKPLTIQLGSSDMRLDLSIRDFLPVLTSRQPDPHRPIMVSGNLTSSRLDLDQIMNHWIEIDTLPPADSDSLNLDLDQPFPELEIMPLNLDFKMNCRQIRYFNLDCTDFKAWVTFRNQRLNQNASARLYQGTLTQDFEMTFGTDRLLGFQMGLITHQVEANDFISRLNDLAPTDLKLFRQLRNTDSVLYGKSDIQARFETEGRTLREIRRNLVGRCRIDVRQGRIEKNRLMESIFSAAGKVDELLVKTGYDKMLFTPSRMEFRDMFSELLIQDEKVILDEFRTSSGQGDWRLTGYATFDGGIDLTVAAKLSSEYSKRLTGLESRGKQGLQQLLQSVGAEKVSGLTDRIGIPKDRNGRVTINIGITGDTERMKGEWRGFGSPDDGSAPAATSGTAAVTDSLKQTAAQTINAAQDSLQKRLEVEKKKQEEAARKKLEDEKKKIQEQLKKRFKF